MNAPADLQLDRRRFIGGSDCAAIFGVSPWATPLDIYLKKRGEMPSTGREADPQRERMFRRGKRLEPIVVDMLIEDEGIKVTKRSTPEEPNRYIDAEHEFLAAEVDFEWEVTPKIANDYDLPEALVGTIQNGEVKTVHPFAAGKFGDESTDEIPIEYAAQAMHGLMVTGRQLAMFAVLVGSDELALYFLKRDDETIAAMREKVVRFWVENVQAGVRPDPVNLTDVYHLFSREAATRIAATPEIAAQVRELLEAGNAAAAANARAEEAKFQIGRFMLGAEQMEKPEKKGRHVLFLENAELLTVQLQAQSRIDITLLKAKHPTVAAECTKQAQFFTFRPKRSKK